MDQPKQCPECERDAKVRCINLRHRFYWIECPKCGRRTIMRLHRIDAVKDWNTGDTYVPEKESDRLPDEYEKIKNQRIIRRW